MVDERRSRVLVVEDDNSLRVTLENVLIERGLSVTASSNTQNAVERIQRETAPYDIVLTALSANGVNGTDVFEAAQRRGHTTEVVIMCGFTTLDVAIECTNRGAFDYITKPFKLAEIDVIFSKIADRKRLVEENRRLSERVQNLYSRLDRLKDNREKMDRFVSDTTAKLDDHGRKIDLLVNLLREMLGLY
jgi:DNA-binding NtrC family response regulator